VPWLTRDIKTSLSRRRRANDDPQLCRMRAAVAEVKQREGLAKTKIVLITDAAGLDKADVKRGLEIMDANNGEVWGKLDAGTQALFQAGEPDAIFSSHFKKSSGDGAHTADCHPKSVHEDPRRTIFVRRIARLLRSSERNCAMRRQYREVHAYTIARSTPEPYVTKLTARELNALAEKIRKQTGLAVLTFE